LSHAHVPYPHQTPLLQLGGIPTSDIEREEELLREERKHTQVEYNFDMNAVVTAAVMWMPKLKVADFSSYSVSNEALIAFG